MRHWITGAFALVLAALGPQTVAAAEVLRIESRKIADHGSGFEITAAYPHSGVAAIDDEIEAWARARIGDFRKMAAGRLPTESGTYTYDLAYEVARNDARAFAVEFTESAYTGGAHGNVMLRSFNYLMPGGYRVDLQEILDGKPALARLSELATADLRRKSAAKGGALDEESIKTGAAAEWDNFHVFLLLPDALKIVFQPYQVGPWVAGVQEVSIPLATLRDSLRADWRTPVASFPCAKAASAVERAVCADVGLARLDREVAAVYARRISAPGYRVATQTRQRAWLSERDAACKNESAAALRACLDGQYRARLAELEKMP